MPYRMISQFAKPAPGGRPDLFGGLTKGNDPEVGAGIDGRLLFGGLLVHEAAESSQTANQAWREPERCA